jgi:hypothetical protein
MSLLSHLISEKERKRRDIEKRRRRGYIKNI